MLDHQQGRRRAPSSNHAGADKQSKLRDDAKRRADYARQIARSEFGRFYWNDERARRLQEAMDRRRKPEGREQARQARALRKTSP